MAEGLKRAAAADARTKTDPTSRHLAASAMAEVERLLNVLPAAGIARRARNSGGEVMLADGDAEIARIAEGIASEHVEARA